MEFLNIWVGWSEFFLNYFGKKAPKVQNLGAFSHLFFSKKVKKHPIWQKLGAIPTLVFLVLFLETGFGRWGQHSNFWVGPNDVMAWALYESDA